MLSQLKQLEGKGRLTFIDLLETSPKVLRSVRERLKKGEDLSIFITNSAVQGLMNSDFTETSKSKKNFDKDSLGSYHLFNFYFI